MASPAARRLRIAGEPCDREELNRDRWSYERSVRTSHGINCSGSWYGFDRAFAAIALVAVAIVAIGITPSNLASAQVADPGQKIFTTVCVACHTVGEGKRVGPDLAGVHERHTEEWMIEFIRSSQAVIKAGDPEAVALAEAYPGLIMPDNPLSDDQIRSVLAYVRELESGAAIVGVTANLAAAKPARKVTKEDVRRGQELFQGNIRFAARGPSCNSCHNVVNDAVIGGGILAKELTSVFSTMGEGGVRAILGKPPFAVMEQAYRDKALTEDEVHALVAFLQHADEQQSFQQPRDYGVGLAGAGAVGTALLLGAYALFFRRRKRASVNQAIYDRQVESE
jgi:mono/diheme cytochrome c family protein